MHPGKDISSPWQRLSLNAGFSQSGAQGTARPTALQFERQSCRGALPVPLSSAGGEGRGEAAFVCLSSKLKASAFTLLELALVLALIAFWAVLLLPALAHTRPNARALRCLNNLTQMQAGAQMYTADFADVLLPNAPLGTLYNPGWFNGNFGENWTTASGNTNPVPYLTGLLAPYIQNQIGLYRCPADTIPSSNGPRIRSYSMNGQMGTIKSSPNYNPGWKSYAKVTDLGASLSPAQAFVFCEESMYTLNDGYLQLNLTTPAWPDLPGSYHNGALGISFADGHVELHQWVTRNLLIPVRFGVTGSNLTDTGDHTDWFWMQAHSATH